MALTDVIFGADNSSFVDRWDGITHPLEMLTEKPVAFVSPNYYGGYWLVNEAFKDSTGTDFPNGTVVHAFHGTTHAQLAQVQLVQGKYLLWCLLIVGLSSS